ncbi:hypothetical protein K435DRAFT_794634 [Dendrothele bispora CBS 962.96]|uniref:Uncharacterized protein n=1 Tax=Dendrothele bispora (strain CBS 962.96) TaxID=1314807 RepID=A0A4S8MBF6_DENBC|nr:hypothetical protein K435DRAFT_794634 [Dendrothele bispora CBS 962.96]
MTSIPTPTGSQTRAQTKLTAYEHESLDKIIQRALNEGIIKEGQNYQEALPRELAKLSQQQLSNERISAAKCLWEKVGLMSTILIKMQESQNTVEDVILGVFQAHQDKLAEIWVHQHWERLEETHGRIDDGVARMEKLMDKTEELQSRMENRDQEAEEQTNGYAPEQVITDGQEKAGVRGLSAQNVAHQLQRPRHAKAIEAAKLRDRRIMVRSTTPSDNNLDENHLVVKANETITLMMGDEWMDYRQTPKVVGVQKLTGGGILCVFHTPEEVRWMMDENRLERFAQHWGSSATVKAPYYETVLPFVPLTTDLHNQQSLREIEVNNGLEKGSIASARWIKPASQRKVGQQVAHAILSFKTRMAANFAIRQHLFIKGKEIYLYKETTEALRCMKCSSY